MVSISELKSLANNNTTSKEVFSAFAHRQRFRSETDLSRFKILLINSGKKIVIDEYMTLFKRLEALGIGTLVMGRLGKPTRFIWNYSLKSVGKAALEDNIAIKSLIKPMVKRSNKPKVEFSTTEHRITLVIPSTINIIDLITKLTTLV